MLRVLVGGDGIFFNAIVYSLSSDKLTPIHIPAILETSWLELTSYQSSILLKRASESIYSSRLHFLEGGQQVLL